MVEDLQSQELDWSGACGPISAPASAHLAQRTAEGQQAGAVNQRAALPTLLPFGLDPDEHFNQAVNRLQEPLPTERAPILDLDLELAAQHTACSRGVLREVRQNCAGALRELKRRWQPLTQHWRQFRDGCHPSCDGEARYWLHGFCGGSSILGRYLTPIRRSPRSASCGLCSVLRSLPAATSQAHRVGRGARWLGSPTMRKS